MWCGHAELEKKKVKEEVKEKQVHDMEKYELCE